MVFEGERSCGVVGEAACSSVVVLVSGAMRAVWRRSQVDSLFFGEDMMLVVVMSPVRSGFVAMCGLFSTVQ